MIKSFYRLLDKRMIILCIILLLASPTLGGINTFDVCLIYSHYLTIYLNNAYLFMMYQYSSRLNKLSSPMIIRLNDHIFYKNSFIIFISMGLIYTFIIYISYFFFFRKIPQYNIRLTLLFMILNIIIISIENIILYMQIGEKKNFVYLALPLLINVCFHFIFIYLF